MKKRPPSKRRAPVPATLALLTVVRDLLLGGRHNRSTVARASGRSLPTADRWLETIEKVIPGARRVKVGKTAWIEIPSTAASRLPPLDVLSRLRAAEADRDRFSAQLLEDGPLAALARAYVELEEIGPGPGGHDAPGFHRRYVDSQMAIVKFVRAQKTRCADRLKKKLEADLTFRMAFNGLRGEDAIGALGLRQPEPPPKRRRRAPLVRSRKSR